MKQLAKLPFQYPVALTQSLQDCVAKDFLEWVQVEGPGEEEVSLLVKGACGGQAMNVRMVGEVITKGVNAQNDTCFPFRNSCRGCKAF